MRRWLPLMALMLVVSCKSKKGTEMQGGLSPALMEQVLVDVNLAESFSLMVKDSTHKGGTKNIDSLAYYYQSIFAHHKISPEQFKVCLDWYKAHPDKLDTLYLGVVNKVTALQNKRPQQPIKPVAPPPITHL